MGKNLLRVRVRDTSPWGHLCCTEQEKYHFRNVINSINYNSANVLHPYLDGVVASWTDYRSVRACLLLHSRRFKRRYRFNHVNTDRQDLPARLQRDSTGKNFTYSACLRTCLRSEESPKQPKYSNHLSNKLQGEVVELVLVCFVNSPTQNFLFFFDVFQFCEEFFSIHWT